jgi:hypothetical protein
MIRLVLVALPSYSYLLNLYVQMKIFTTESAEDGLIGHCFAQ